ncbi:hypothetical protein TNCV_3035231 [Trichonephila clavipes]|nr:hypothetical protein TNCV_3035231 [Trichonephila clavipes]
MKRRTPWGGRTRDQRDPARKEPPRQGRAQPNVHPSLADQGHTEYSQKYGIGQSNTVGRAKDSNCKPAYHKMSSRNSSRSEY